MRSELANIGIAIWGVFLEASPYVLFGLVAAAVIYAFFPKEKIDAVMGGRSLGSVSRAALVGIPLPLCSCAVVPTALSLRDRGAGRGATVAFLISTPETGVDSIALTAGMLGPVMAVLRPVAAFVTAIVAGVTVNRLPDAPGPDGSDSPAENCPDCGEANHDGGDNCKAPFRARLAVGARYIHRDFFPDIANWLFGGLIVSGLIAALLPANFFLFASPGMQYLLALVAGIPIYVCASASTPVAAALIATGLSPGAAMIFLLAGPATNAASLGIIARRLGVRTSVVYLVVIAVVSLLVGLGTDALLAATGWSVTSVVAHGHAEHGGVVAIVSTAILMLLILEVWVLKLVGATRRRDVGRSLADDHAG